MNLLSRNTLKLSVCAIPAVVALLVAASAAPLAAQDVALFQPSVLIADGDRFLWLSFIHGADNTLEIGAVDASSDAASKGLQRGDIVLSANYRDIATVADLDGVIEAAKRDNRAAVLLRVQRRGQPALFVPLRMR